ncbi:MAG: EAL domain-containing protein [Burkholderiaceae bacterium]|nr:EAL domain-containing protein [Burkholderiaceae bacterium]
MPRFHFPKLPDYPGAVADFLRLTAWISGVLLLIGLLWVATESEINSDQREQQAAALKQSEALATSYALQLANFVEQLDQLSLSIAFNWVDMPQRIDLQRDRERGLFPVRDHFFVAVIDAQGRVVHASSQPRQYVNLSGYEFFRHHRDYCCDGLRITGSVDIPLIGMKMTQFSRRIDDSNGRFAGVVMIAVQPNFLSTFQDEVLHGGDEFAAALLDSRQFIATRAGNDGSTDQSFFLQRPSFAGALGSRIEPGSSFHDGLERVIAWRKLDRYPLVAITGLMTHRILAGHHAAADGYRNSAVIATVFLSLLAVGGIFMSLRFTSRRRAEEDVRRTYRMATDAANEGFYMLKPVFSDKDKLEDFRIEDCNDRAANLLGTLRIHLVGKMASEVMPENSHTELLSICRRALSNGIYEDELRVPSHGWIRATWVYRRAVHSGTGIALTLRDISDIKTHEQALADLANNDPLTQLPNRRWLMNFLPAAIRRAERGRGKLALMFIDLDNFKGVNDTIGHPAGDEVLVQAATRVRETVRASDYVVRLGGDEFTVVLDNADSEEAVARIAGELINRLSEPYPIASTMIATVSASIGISLFPEDGNDSETLIKHADVAMYAAKADGKSRYHFYDPKLSDELIRKMSIESALRDAVERDEFLMHYQPRVSASTGRLCSIEALLRWQHPERGLLMPGMFIATAEEAGLINAIGELVVQKVVAQIAQWREQGMSLVPVSLNVSPRQLQQGQIAACIARALNTYQVPAHLVEIEVTESAMVDRGAATSAELDALRAMGIRLMIDDFGTGYSSLAQLHRLDVDVLKVDQAFTHSLAHGSEGEQLYRAIVSMAAALDMHVVAEGVETVEQLRILQAIGCDEIQGYIIAPAVPAEQMAALAREGFLPPFDHAGQLPA